MFHLIIFLQRILKQLLKAKGNINLGKNCIKRRDLSASTVTTDQIINKSDVVGSVSYSIALVNFSMPFLQKIIWYFKWQGNLKFVNIFPDAIIRRLAANFCLSRSPWFELKKEKTSSEMRCRYYRSVFIFKF